MFATVWRSPYLDRENQFISLEDNGGPIRSSFTLTHQLTTTLAPQRRHGHFNHEALAGGLPPGQVPSLSRHDVLPRPHEEAHMCEVSEGGV